MGFIDDSRPLTTWGNQPLMEELDDEVSHYFLLPQKIYFSLLSIFNFQLPNIIPMRAPPADPPMSRLSYINDILCDEEICEVIREDEKSRAANTSTRPPQSSTVHVRQVRFGGGGGRVSSGGSLGGRKKFATVSSISFGRDPIASPTPSVHFQVHQAPRSSPKKRYMFRFPVQPHDPKKISSHRASHLSW